MKQINLKIVTPAGVYIDQPVDIVTVRTMTGYTGFLAGHIPFVSSIVPSKITYRINNQKHILHTSGGIIQTQPEFVKIIVGNIQTDQARQASLTKKTASAVLRE